MEPIPQARQPAIRRLVDACPATRFILENLMGEEVQGELEFGRVISCLGRYHYERALTVDVRDVPESPFAVDAEVRKLKYLLESLV